jgi:hypothetical protein
MNTDEILKRLALPRYSPDAAPLLIEMVQALLLLVETMEHLEKDRWGGASLSKGYLDACAAKSAAKKEIERLWKEMEEEVQL